MGSQHRQPHAVWSAGRVHQVLCGRQLRPAALTIVKARSTALCALTVVRGSRVLIIIFMAMLVQAGWGGLHTFGWCSISNVG